MELDIKKSAPCFMLAAAIATALLFSAQQLTPFFRECIAQFDLDLIYYLSSR